MSDLRKRTNTFVLEEIKKHKNSIAQGFAVQSALEKREHLQDLALALLTGSWMVKWLNNSYLEPLFLDFTRERERGSNLQVLFVARSCGWLVVSVCCYGQGLSWSWAVQSSLMCFLLIQSAHMDLGYFWALKQHVSQVGIYAVVFKERKENKPKWATKETLLSALLDIEVNNTPVSAVYLTT